MLTVYKRMHFTSVQSQKINETEMVKKTQTQNFPLSRSKIKTKRLNTISEYTTKGKLYRESPAFSQKLDSHLTIQVTTLYRKL